MNIYRILRGGYKYISDYEYRYTFNAGHGLYKKVSDKEYLEKFYRAKFHKDLDLECPTTYNEKIQWLKLYDHRPIYTIMVDKYLMKEYVASIVGEKYVVPLLAVWDNPNDISIDKLPNQFVLKCNHDCGGIVICKDKKTFDLKKARKKLNKANSTDYYSFLREWPYKNVVHKIIAEPYLEDTKTGELRDYKFFCFNGKVILMFVASDRQNNNTDTKFDFFDMNYNHLNIINGHPNAETPPEKPEGFELMKKLAAVLSKGFPHIRVDFYEVDGRVYVGELTLYHWSGMVPFEPEEWDTELGKCIELPIQKSVNKAI